MPRLRRDMRQLPALSGSTLAMSHRHHAFSPRFVPLLRLTAAVLAGTVMFQGDQRLWAQAPPPAAGSDTEMQAPERSTPDDLAPIAGPNRDFPWWPWILAVPALGGGLWWLLRTNAPTPPSLALGTVGAIQAGRRSEEKAEQSKGATEGIAGGIAGGSPEDGATASDRASDQVPEQTALDQPAMERRIILVTRSSHAAYAYWELPPSEVDALQRRNYRLALKVHDVTDIEQVDGQSPHATEMLACPTTTMGDCHLPIPQADRDYLAELGYQDESSTWHALVRSEPVRVLAQPNSVEPPPATTPLALEIASTTAPAPEATPQNVSPGLDAEQGRAVNAAIPRPGTTAAMASLVAQTCQNALARWEIPPDQVADLKTGKRRLAVRLYDVTELPGFLASHPNSVQEFEAELAPQTERMLPIAVDDRDYLIEVGYVDGRGQWYVLAKSSPVRVPAC